MTTDETPNATRQPQATELTDVRVTFSTGDDAITALDGLNLAVPTGTVFCLLGPNGAGKTTAINVITGLVAPDAGRVRVFGRDPGAHRRRVLSDIALVPQETALYERLTARENLEFHGRFYGVDSRSLPHRIDAALDLVGLISRQHDRVETYSGGMRRRLALARALLSDAQLVLLDEPTLGVDVQSRNAIWDQIRTLAEQGTAVVLTTNYMDEAEELADTILLIDEGREVISGTGPELKAAVGGQTLVLRFGSDLDARNVLTELDRSGRSAVRTGAAVSVDLDSADHGLREIRDLSPMLTGGTAERLERFELREPSLQDVFLHFTGRELRD